MKYSIKDLTDPPQELFSGAHLRAVRFGKSPRVLVSFDHWRAQRNGFPEAKRVASTLRVGFSHVIIQSAANDWFLNADLPDLAAMLSAHLADAEDVCGIGFSMGGYGCALLGRALHLRRMLLISPQFSICPAKVPWEERWRKEGEALAADPARRALDDLPHALAADESWAPRGIVLFDPILWPADKRHARAILQHAPGLTGAATALGGHPATQNVLGGVGFMRLMVMLMQNRLAPITIRRLHRKMREDAPLYEQRLSRLMLRRFDGK